MRKQLVSVILLLHFMSMTAFAHSAAIESDGGSGYRSVRLTPQIYNASNSDLSDILIKNDKDETVPYFIHTGSQNLNQSRESYPMEQIDSYLKDDYFYFDYKLAFGRDRDMIATSIEVVTRNTNFAKAVDVYGSHDGLNWQFVQDDKLYSIDGQSKLGIEFMKPQKYTYYRFRLANNLEKISFDAVDLIYNIETSDKTYFVEGLTPMFRVENKDKKTYIEIEGLKNLRLCDVTIKTDSMFKRTASAPSGISKEIYNLSLNGTTYTDLTIPLDWQIPQDEAYTISIADNDDKPVDISGITVRYYVDEIIFEAAEGERYMLEFGADAAKKAPIYDIARYKDEILKGSIARAAIGGIRYNQEQETPPQRDYTFIFNIVVIVIALLLGVLILLRLKRGGSNA